MIDRKEFARRRKQLMRIVGGDGISIVPAAPERLRNNDSHYPYRQDSDFHYLTGFAEPEAVLALIPGREHGEVILFCRERNPEREAWDGVRAGQDGAVRDYGMDDAFPIDDIDDILPGLRQGGAESSSRRRLSDASLAGCDYEDFRHVAVSLSVWSSAAILRSLPASQACTGFCRR
jgi:Xaa-Pro aminopeptidase